MEYANNFFTYLRWRGDLPVKDYPFNEVDALILSELVYIEFENIVPEVGEEGAIRIQDAEKRYRRKKGKNVLYYAQKEELFTCLANSPRFADMTMDHYISTIDLVEQQQFAAMHIAIAPNLVFIAFRGTDSTIVGWREDFNMSYMMPVPAQQSAVDYVNQTAKGLFKKYWLGGHSKGGNLAIYSGVYCNPKIQRKIVRISSFDGPGFNRKVVNEPQYQMVKERIDAYVPVSSIVGMLMEHEEDYKVVASCETSLKQHEGFSWQVDGTKFVLVQEVDEFSQNISRIFQSWLNKVDIEERKIFIDAFFDVLEQAGIEEVSDLVGIDVRTAATLVKGATKVAPQIRELIVKLIKMFIEEGTHK